MTALGLVPHRAAGSAALRSQRGALRFAPAVRRAILSPTDAAIGRLADSALAPPSCFLLTPFTNSAYL